MRYNGVAKGLSFAATRNIDDKSLSNKLAILHCSQVFTTRKALGTRTTKNTQMNTEPLTGAAATAPQLPQNGASRTLSPARLVKKIIVEGMTRDGRKFRPSDWAERMSGSLSTFGRDHRIQYSPMLQPLTLNGVKCIALDPRMKEHCPEMFSYIMGWASNNNLVITEIGSNGVPIETAPEAGAAGTP